MNRWLKWETWLHGLMAGIIGGAAASGVSWLGMTGAKAAGADVPVLNLKSLGVILLSSGIFNALLYLKQSPLPAISTVTETTITQETATTVQTATKNSDRPIT